MRKSTIVLTVFTFIVANPIFLIAQHTYFGQYDDWDAVANRAKAENKFIFIDCYTTWCGPCKQMDKEVYTNDTVRDYLNAHFISVKIQMDRTIVDDTHTKHWYKIADWLTKAYSVNAYPTVLFFSPDGTPVHKSVGATLPASAFLKVLEDAMNPDRQYYSILKNYLPGKLDTNELRGLAKSIYYDKALAGKIAYDYLKRINPAGFYIKENLDFISNFAYDTAIQALVVKQVEQFHPFDFRDKLHQALLFEFTDNGKVQQLVKAYLDSQTDQELTDNRNLLLIWNFVTIVQLHDRYFELPFKKPWKDPSGPYKKLGGVGYSHGIVELVLEDKIAGPELLISDSLHKEPDWTILLEELKMAANMKYARLVITEDKIHYYRSHLYEAEETKSNQRFYYGERLASTYMEKVENYIKINNVSSDIMFGSYSWTVFQYSNRKKEMNAALKWIDRALAIIGNQNPNAGYIDTKANLLYKLGRKQEALDLEEKAVTLAPDDNDIVEAFQKMKADKPTWELANEIQ